MAQRLQFDERTRHRQLGIIGMREDREDVELDLVSHPTDRIILKSANCKLQNEN